MIRVGIDTQSRNFTRLLAATSYVKLDGELALSSWATSLSYILSQLFTIHVNIANECNSIPGRISHGSYR